MCEPEKGGHWAISVILLTVTVCTCGASHLQSMAILLDVPPGSGSPQNTDGIVQYVFYDTEVCFNEANAVCAELGGTPAKIETLAKRQWIEALDTSGNNIISNDHLWLGLVDPAQDHYWISDCSRDLDIFLIEGDWDSSKSCLVLKSGTFLFDRKSCNDNHKFLCQLQTAITLAETNVDPAHTCSPEVDALCPNGTTPSAPSTTTSTTTTPLTMTSTTTTLSTTTTTTTTPSTATSTTTTPSTTTSTTTTPLTTTSTTTTSSTTTPTTTTLSTSTFTTTTPSTTTPATLTNTPSLQSTQICIQVTNISLHEVREIAEEISKNLTIDAKATSSHRRKLTSANDKRPSAKFIGYVGLLIVMVPFVFIFITDLINMLGSILHRSS